jgi:hypothetical protein
VVKYLAEHSEQLVLGDRVHGGGLMKARSQTVPLNRSRGEFGPGERGDPVPAMVDPAVDRAVLA